MTEPVKFPPEVVKLAKRPEVRLIAGAALGGLALGLYVGIKIAGPRSFTPSVKVPTPCTDCEEKAKAALAYLAKEAQAPAGEGPTPSPADLSPAQLAELRARIEAQVVYPVIPPPIPDPVPVDG